MSHGSFYRYFDNKDDFFRVLAEEASTRMVELLDALPDRRARGRSSGRWLDEWFATYESNGGVISTWQEMQTSDADLVELRPAGGGHGDGAADGACSTSAGFGDPLVDALALLAVVERLPYSVYTLRFTEARRRHRRHGHDHPPRVPRPRRRPHAWHASAEHGLRVHRRAARPARQRPRACSSRPARRRWCAPCSTARPTARGPVGDPRRPRLARPRPAGGARRARPRLPRGRHPRGGARPGGGARRRSWPRSRSSRPLAARGRLVVPPRRHRRRARAPARSPSPRTASGDSTPSRTTARRTGGGWVLDGVKTHVVDGATADEIAVVARGDDGLGAFVVPRHRRAGHGPSTVIDPTLPVATVTLAGVEVTGERVLVEPGDPAAERDHRAGARGGHRRDGAVHRGHLPDDLRDDAPVRQGPRAVRQADRLVPGAEAPPGRLLPRRRAGRRRSATSPPSPSPRTTHAGRSPRRWPRPRPASASACSSRDGLQLHGGIGFTWENDLHFALKRAKAGDLLFGTAAFHRARLAELLGLAA